MLEVIGCLWKHVVKQGVSEVGESKGGFDNDVGVGVATGHANAVDGVAPERVVLRK